VLAVNDGDIADVLVARLNAERALADRLAAALRSIPDHTWWPEATAALAAHDAARTEEGP